MCPYVYTYHVYVCDVCVYVCAYIDVCICVYVCYVGAYVCTCAHVYMWTYVYVCTCVRDICTYVFLCTCIYVCIWGLMYMCVHMYVLCGRLYMCVCLHIVYVTRFTCVCVYGRIHKHTHVCVEGLSPTVDHPYLFINGLSTFMCTCSVPSGRGGVPETWTVRRRTNDKRVDRLKVNLFYNVVPGRLVWTGCQHRTYQVTDKIFQCSTVVNF